MRLLEWLGRIVDGTPRISRRRAWEAWSREEMDRHPVERVELWRGMEGPHYPVGLPLRRFEVSKAPVFRRGLVAGLLLVAGVVSAGEPVARIGGRAGTMCPKGEKYEAVRVDGAWKALCYRDVDLEDARNLVGADTSLPNSEGRRGLCMTCPTVGEELELEMLYHYRTRYWGGRWYSGPRGWR